MAMRKCSFVSRCLDASFALVSNTPDNLPCFYDYRLRFANRLKNKNSKKKAETQEYAAPVRGAPASVATSSGSSSEGSIPESVPPTFAGATAQQAAKAAPATVSNSVSPASTVVGVAASAPALQQPTPAPAPQQQQIWGELAKRYNTMWNATQIPTLAAGLHAPMPAPAPGVLGTSSAAITALAAAAAVRSNPGLLASLAGNPMVAAPTPSTPALLNAVAAATAPAPATVPQHPRRRPTLDDLCSILNVENLSNKGK